MLAEVLPMMLSPKRTVMKCPNPPALELVTRSKSAPLEVSSADAHAGLSNELRAKDAPRRNNGQDPRKKAPYVDRKSPSVGVVSGSK